MTPTPSADVVTRELRGKVLLVTIDHPPVNALSADVRRGLLAAIEAADADRAVEAVLIVGAGRNFIARCGHPRVRQAAGAAVAAGRL